MYFAQHQKVRRCVLVHTHNLPTQTTPFIGRTTELSEIEQLLMDPGCRLLTLVGHGGIGKTRLAMHVATQHADRFPQGVYFVPLAPLTSAEYLVPALLNSLQLQFDSNDKLRQQLFTYLHDKRLLLVLDNFEHLLADVQ